MTGLQLVSRTYNRYTHTIHFAVWIDRKKTQSRDPVYILWGAGGPAKIRIILTLRRCPSE